MAETGLKTLFLLSSAEHKIFEVFFPYNDNEFLPVLCMNKNGLQNIVLLCSIEENHKGLEWLEESISEWIIDIANIHVSVCFKFT